MKQFKIRLLTLCGLMVLAAASLAPIAAKAACPTVPVSCPGGVLRQCQGEQVGKKCYYDADCLNCA